MITTVIRAATGSGIRRAVPKFLKDFGMDPVSITVISHMRELEHNWKHMPEVIHLRPHQWRQRAHDPHGHLVIVEECHWDGLYRLLYELRLVDAEVWLLNPRGNIDCGDKVSRIIETKHQGTEQLISQGWLAPLVTGVTLPSHQPPGTCPRIQDENSSRTRS